jgi:hypothetical protein
MVVIVAFVSVYFAVLLPAAYPTVTLRYRLTLEAMTPDGPKTGSSVIEVSYGSEFNLNGGRRKGRWHVTGEAVPLDLGQGKYLFATLTDNASGRPNTLTDGSFNGATDAHYLPVIVFGLKWDWGEETKLPPQIAAAEAAGPKDVPLYNLPTLVTFKDINDPATVELVNPSMINEVFGPGYLLVRATLSVTHDRPNSVIETVLNWPEKFKSGGSFDGTHSPGPNDPIASQLGYGYLKMGEHDYE